MSKEIWRLRTRQRKPMSKNKKDIHVIPHKDGWAIKREGATRVSETFSTQDEAYKSARQDAIRDKVEVVTHRRDGTIRDSDSFGPDPNPPRDKKH
jgi:hypothetical protein